MGITAARVYSKRNQINGLKESSPNHVNRLMGLQYYTRARTRSKEYRRGVLTVYVQLAVFRVFYVVLLGHYDVLDVFHGEVITERVVKKTLQLFHSQLLHITLETHKDTRYTHTHTHKTSASCVTSLNSCVEYVVNFI